MARPGREGKRLCLRIAEQGLRLYLSQRDGLGEKVLEWSGTTQRCRCGERNQVRDPPPGTITTWFGLGIDSRAVLVRNPLADVTMTR